MMVSQLQLCPGIVQFKCAINDLPVLIAFSSNLFSACHRSQGNLRNVPADTCECVCARGCVRVCVCVRARARAYASVSVCGRVCQLPSCSCLGAKFFMLGANGCFLWK
jgi:hypothetical protein